MVVYRWDLGQISQCHHYPMGTLTLRLFLLADLLDWGAGMTDKTREVRDCLLHLVVSRCLPANATVATVGLLQLTQELPDDRPAACNPLGKFGLAKYVIGHRV